MSKIICDSNKCTGCMLCKEVCNVDAIYQVEDKLGFLYTEIDTNKCVSCNKCVKICPSNLEVKHNLNNRKVYSFINNDLKILKKSSSGGVFYEIAKNFIKNKGIVYGVCLNKDMKVEYKRVTHIKELESVLSSKYIQCYLGDTYKKVSSDLDNGKRVLYVGTPCTVNSLKKYLGKEYKNLLTIDLLCHGVPSQKFFDSYINNVKNDFDKDIIGYNFRNKRYGWETKTIELKLSNNKSQYIKEFKDPYMIAFNKRLSTRVACDTCKYSGVNRVGDITLGDFWGINNFDKNIDNKSGVSIVMSNNQIGEDVIARVKENFEIKSVDEIFAIKGNGALQAKNINVKDKIDFMEEFHKNGFTYVRNKYLKPNAKNSIINLFGKNNIRKIVSLRNKLFRRKYE